MDLQKTIEELRREKKKLDRVIASIEDLQGAMMPAAVQKKRLGRKRPGPKSA